MPDDSSAGIDPRLVPPKADEVELSLFGPGYGEAVVVHLGEGEWLLVDSCQDRSSGDSAPIAYLRSLGLDPAEVVKIVLTTHWHDDHVRGMSQVVRACESAEFVCSQALRVTEFRELVYLYEPHSMARSSGVKEFYGVLGTLEERAEHGASPVVWALAERMIYKREREDLLASCEVHSLSPSDKAVTDAFQAWADLVSSSEGVKRRIPSQPPNRTAVVLWLRVGKQVALLGADLEEVGIPTDGWAAIITSQRRPSQRATAYKVAHHGSSTGDHPDIWIRLLETQPVAVLSPFVKGSVKLPTSEDVERILEHAPESFITAPPRPKRTNKRSGAVARTLRESTKYVREAQPPLGQVRLRAPVDSDTAEAWRVERFDPARELKKLRSKDHAV